MRKLLIAGAVSAFLFTGCAPLSEQVPTGHVAKVITKAGFLPDTYEPGYATCWGSDKIVLLQTTTNTAVEQITVKMADDLDLGLDVRVRMRLAPSKLDALFNDIQPKWDDNNKKRGSIRFDRIYQTYGVMQVRNVCRSVLTKYKVADVKANYDKIRGEMNEALREALANTPIQLEDLSPGGWRYPKVITSAYELKAQRIIEVDRIEAEKAKDLAAMEAQLVLAQKEREIELTKAATVRDYNRIIGEGINESWMIHRHYEVLEKMAANNNAVFMPYEAYRPDNAGLQNSMASRLK